MLTAKSGYVFLLCVFICEVLGFLQIAFMGEWWVCVLCAGLNQLGSAGQTKSLSSAPQAVPASFLPAQGCSRPGLTILGGDRSMFREGRAAAPGETLGTPPNTCIPRFCMKTLKKSLILKLFCLHCCAQRSITLPSLLKVSISFFAVSLCTACLVVTFKLL